MDNVSAKFEAHVGPVREALKRFLDEEASLVASRTLPEADSPAMTEIAEERHYTARSPWGDDPVRQAHNFSQLLMFSASDMAGGLVRLLQDEPSVFAHMALARAAIEHAGRGFLLLDPSASLKLRIARGMNDRLFGLYESDDLKIPGTERSGERIDAILSIGQEKGFSTVGNRRVYLEEGRLNATKLTSLLLGDEDKDSSGRVIYKYFSAVTHGTAYGLTQSVDTDVPGGPEIPGVTVGAVFTGSGPACTVMGAVILALCRAFDARSSLFGWRSEKLGEACKAALSSARAAMERS